MKKIFITLFTIAATIPAFAQSYIVKPQFHVGDSVAYSQNIITHVFAEDNSYSMDMNINYKYGMKIREKNDSGFVQSFCYKDIKVTNGEGKSDEITSAVEESMKQSAHLILFQLDKNGTPIDVLNYKEILLAYANMADKTFNEKPALQLTMTREQFLKAVVQQYTKEHLLAILNNSIYGKPIEKGQTIEMSMPKQAGEGIIESTCTSIILPTKTSGAVINFASTSNSSNLLNMKLDNTYTFFMNDYQRSVTTHMSAQREVKGKKLNVTMTSQTNCIYSDWKK